MQVGCLALCVKRPPPRVSADSLRRPNCVLCVGGRFVVRYQMGRLYALFWMKVLAWESRIRPDMQDASNRGQLRGIYIGGQTHPWTSWLRWPARSAKRFI